MTGRGFTQLLMWNKKERNKRDGGERMWRAGARTEKKKKRQPRKGKKENGRTEREKDKAGLNGDRK